ncbi:Ankyrin repeat domain-containing protein 2 [Tetrabaena socialis]|uniref:Ankyrin repeat domain-containing protein 2 n=1 Tax=Tetrabaena socialis TaxID=47790 RepID=A0A2J8AIB6_9CHLO|nr:Ankyrin repeat domain-containing protein 2 [Tetrabaena socialis]|eukprot:PNH12255.1 Ankyrin repeat domain-containing protein 2 [Tetrabaena socialis]
MAKGHKGKAGMPVPFPDVESAVRAMERANGAQLDGRTLAIEFVQVPIKIPPGMPTAQAQALVAYLKSPVMQEKLVALQDDPELGHIFAELRDGGAAAFQKYWDDTDLMLKISQKLRALDMDPNAPQGVEGDAAAAAEPPAKKLIANLHDAAKHGDLDAATRFLEEGADVNEHNDRGISALGVAVGFNRLEVVKLLIEKGGDLKFRDPKANNLMHYAAGYGRMAIAKVLLAAGAELGAKNEAGQAPADVAKMNGERDMLKFLESYAAIAARIAEKTAAPAADAAAAEPAEATA